MLEDDEGFRLGDEWVEVPAEGSSTFWYNKTAAFAQWHEPPDLRARLIEMFEANARSACHAPRNPDAISNQ